jgi:hypothetical protein
MLLYTLPWLKDKKLNRCHARLPLIYKQMAESKWLMLLKPL